VLELTVAPAGRDQPPAVGIDQLERIPHLHAAMMSAAGRIGNPAADTATH
jgi:hypothetical protein